MDNEAKINISFLITFVGLLLVLILYPLVIANPINFWSLDSASPQTVNYTLATGVNVNEDVQNVYNITINNTAAWKGNITLVNISFFGNFVFANDSNKTGGNLTAPGSNIDVSIIFRNTSDQSQLSWINATATTVVVPHANITFSNSTFTFNATSFTPGNYNLTVDIFWNATYSDYNRTNISIRVNDTTKPYYINVSGENGPGFNRSFTNASKNIMINVTAYDNGNFSLSNNQFPEIVEVNITVYNNTVGVNASYNTSNVTKSDSFGSNWNVSINTSNFPDGVYNITIYAKDQGGNINVTNITNIRFDNTAPTGSISCTPGTVNVGDTVTCSCSPSDSTSGVNTSATALTASPSTVNTGTFTEKCTYADMSGNTATSSTTYTVELGASGTSSKGGGSSSSAEAEATLFYTKTIPVVAQEFKAIETITQQLGAKERVKVKINETIHYIGVREVTLTSAIIEIASEAVQVELKAGEETKSDVNNDGFYDVYVKLNAIINGKADLVIKYIQEEVPPETVSAKETVKEVTPKKTEAKEMNLVWLWLVIAVIVIIIVFWWAYSRRK